MTDLLCFRCEKILFNLYISSSSMISWMMACEHTNDKLKKKKLSTVCADVLGRGMLLTSIVFDHV